MAKDCLYIQARTQSKEYDLANIKAELKINKLGLQSHVAGMEKKLLEAGRALDHLLVQPSVDFNSVEDQVTAITALERKMILLIAKGVEYYDEK